MMNNIGRYDRIIRFVLGAFLLSLVFWGPQTAWGYVGLILMGTSAIKFCPLYSLMGLNTNI